MSGSGRTVRRCWSGNARHKHDLNVAEAVLPIMASHARALTRSTGFVRTLCREP